MCVCVHLTLLIALSTEYYGLYLAGFTAMYGRYIVHISCTCSLNLDNIGCNSAVKVSVCHDRLLTVQPILTILTFHEYHRITDI